MPFIMTVDKCEVTGCSGREVGEFAAHYIANLSTNPQMMDANKIAPALQKNQSYPSVDVAQVAAPNTARGSNKQENGIA